MLQLRKFILKDNLSSFKKLREQNKSEFDSKVLNLTELLITKISSIDQDISKMLLERTCLHDISNSIKYACPGILHAIKIDRNDIFELSKEENDHTSCECYLGYENNTNPICDKCIQKVISVRITDDRRKSLPSNGEIDQSFTVSFNRKRFNSLCKDKSYFPMFKFKFDSISPHDKIMEIVDKELDSDEDNIKMIVDECEKRKTKNIKIVIQKKCLLMNTKLLFDSKEPKQKKSNVTLRKINKNDEEDVEIESKKFVERKPKITEEDRSIANRRISNNTDQRTSRTCKPKVIIEDDNTFAKKPKEFNSDDGSLSEETMECIRLAYPEQYRDTDDSMNISAKNTAVNPKESDEEEYSLNYCNNLFNDTDKNCGENKQNISYNKSKADNKKTRQIKQERASKFRSSRHEVKLGSQNESSEENEYCFDDFGGADLKTSKTTKNKTTRIKIEQSKSSSEHSIAKEDYTNCDSMNTIISK